MGVGLSWAHSHVQEGRAPFAIPDWLLLEFKLLLEFIMR